MEAGPRRARNRRDGSLEVEQSTASVLDQTGGVVSGISWVALTVELPCGYHQFEIEDESMSLIVVPEKCWLGPIEKDQKIWGVAAQLYLLRSERNWGIGDFTDLNNLIDIVAGWGAVGDWTKSASRTVH